MGRELDSLFPVARETFDEADAALGYSLSQLCFEGPEDKLKLTEITQPAILTVSVAAWRVLQSQGITPAYVAGHSLGEYSAHVAAGTLSFEDAGGTHRQKSTKKKETITGGGGGNGNVVKMGGGGVNQSGGGNRHRH